MTLQGIGERCGTDKATVHSYLPVYEEILGHLRDEPITLLEIGVAMGQSLAMWLEWLPKATICGMDNRLPTFAGPERLRLFEIDQRDEKSLNRLANEMEFDVVIDDGSHRAIDQLLSCHILWRALKPGGYYFVEDIQGIERVHHWQMMPGARCWPLLKGGRGDDILVLMRKPK